MNAIASASIFSVLKINALILPFSPLSHVCLWDIAVALAAQMLIKLSHLKAFILSFSFSSNKKAKIHFQSLNWNLMRFWRCYYLEGNQLWGKSWGFLRYFQWHPRVSAVFSCSHSFWFDKSGISIKETLSKKLRSGLQKLTGTCQECFGLQIHLERWISSREGLISNKEVFLTAFQNVCLSWITRNQGTCQAISTQFSPGHWRLFLPVWKPAVVYPDSRDFS